jgi:uncharacterized protein (DUF697 family)
MAGIRDFASIWKNVREVDLRPIREAALKMVHITIVGRPGSGRHTLAEQLRMDPAKPGMHQPTPIKVLDLHEVDPLPPSELLILVLDATQSDFTLEGEAAKKLGKSGQPVLVFVNKMDLASKGQVLRDWIDWPIDRLVYGSATQSASLTKQFVPAVMELLADYHLSLARHYPLFRVTIAQHLINDTSFSNAAYAFSTGLAEIVPALGVPLNLTDMVVLTKAQAFLVYRLGLAVGYSTEWRDYIAEFSSVIGSGFLLRQVARQLVGLIPVWGIVPKVGVSYAGTYVVGNAVLKWYLTGKHLTPEQMRALYRQAFEQGKTFARVIVSKAPRPRLPFGRKARQLSAPGKVCPHCGKSNAKDAAYCQYCGLPITAQD